MSTQPLPQSTYPIFTPNGDVVQVPDTELKNAMAQGGKLAVQMHTPDGHTRFVPHDMVGEAQKHGAMVNSDQGMPATPQEKEGFWHSLGSVFGLTSDQLEASGKQQLEHPMQSLAERTGYGMGPSGNMIASTIRNAPGLAQKAISENTASGEALLHGDIKGFLAHQLGMVGYGGATALSPILGDSPAKAGEQLGEGNIKGGLGTTAGIVAPIVIPDAMKMAGKAIPEGLGDLAKRTVVGNTVGRLPFTSMVDSDLMKRPTFKDFYEAVTAKPDPQMALFNKTPKLGDSPIMATADKPLSATPIQDALNKPSTGIMGQLDDVTRSNVTKELQARAAAGDKNAQGILKQMAAKDPAGLAKDVEVDSVKQALTDATKTNSPEQARAALEQAAQKLFGKSYADLNITEKMKTLSEGAKIQNADVPRGTSTVPRVLSGEGVLNQALTGLDNKTLLKIARSRGIDVTKEAQLKPGAADNTVINKIIDNFTPDELDELRNVGLEVSRNKPVQADLTPQQGKELWHFKVLSQYFPDVAVPKAMEGRARFYMAKRPVASVQGNPAQATGTDNLEQILRDSLKARGIDPDKGK